MEHRRGCGDELEDGPRPLALVTGASRRKGIGAAIAVGLARGGWDVATTFWRAYDKRMPWEATPPTLVGCANSSWRAGSRRRRSRPI